MAVLRQFFKMQKRELVRFSKWSVTKETVSANELVVEITTEQVTVCKSADKACRRVLYSKWLIRQCSLIPLFEFSNFESYGFSALVWSCLFSLWITAPKADKGWLFTFRGFSSLTFSFRRTVPTAITWHLPLCSKSPTRLSVALLFCLFRLILLVVIDLWWWQRLTMQKRYFLLKQPHFTFYQKFFAVGMWEPFMFDACLALQYYTR